MRAADPSRGGDGAASSRSGSSTQLWNALSGLLFVTLVSAFSVVVIKSRNPVANDTGSWAVRRPRPIGDDGAIKATRIKALPDRRGRLRVFGHAGRGAGPSRDLQPSTCYSLWKPDVCPQSGPLPCDPKRKQPNCSEELVCTQPLDDHNDARKNVRICGQKLPRRNPCWQDGDKIACLPYFFIIGEMKCGTTTLYKWLAQHPLVRPPRNKEVRYLHQPKYRRYTGTWYAKNFESVLTAPNAVTFDASPTTFNALQVAPGWCSKWLPEAKFVLMLRDPVQRTYSHFRMGMNWLRASHCFVDEHGLRAPIPLIRMHLPNVSNFAWQVQRCTSLCFLSVLISPKRPQRTIVHHAMFPRAPSPPVIVVTTWLACPIRRVLA